MSAVAMACWPQQMRAMPGENPGLPSTSGAADGTDEQHLDLCALAKHAVALLHATGHLETSEVQVELPEEPVFARVSRRRLEQVLLHLITDAVEARRAAGTALRPVRVRVEPQDDFGDYGPSLHVRYAAAETPEPGGTPEAAPQAGLVSARELVESLGGLFTVRSRGLTGTTLSVELPDQGTASW